jgi:hypothetical protein
MKISIDAKEVRFIDIENELDFEGGNYGTQLYMDYVKNLSEFIKNAKDADVINSVNNIISIMPVSRQVEFLALMTSVDKNYSFENFDDMVALWKKAKYAFIQKHIYKIKELLDFFTVWTQGVLSILPKAEVEAETTSVSTKNLKKKG